jgi:hypothetical protein
VNESYYGVRKGTTHLDIYWEPFDNGDRIIHRKLVDQEAYDTWHLSLYFKEVIAYNRELISDPQLDLGKVPRKEKNLLLYLASVASGGDSILELGSSLFEVIDGLEVVQKILSKSDTFPESKPVEDLSFLGVELSECLRSAATVLHPGYGIDQYAAFRNIKADYDLLYDRAVSSYTFTSAEELALCINRSRIAVANLYLSKNETFVTGALGKSLTYFSLAELIESLDRPLYHLFGLRAPGPETGSRRTEGHDVVEGFFLSCIPEIAERFMSLANQDPAIGRYFADKGVKLSEAEDLF